METVITPSLTHIALQVRDLDACVRFYASYAGMRIIHERATGTRRIVWMAEPGREQELIIVLLPGGAGRDKSRRDFSHLGFAVAGRADVDAIAQRARDNGILIWEPVDEPYPVGYYCGVSDPDGNFVEFSYGQPLGPGAEEAVSSSS